MSATMDEGGLNRIAENLDLPRDNIVVLYTSSDRPNIYQQMRPLKKPIDVMYVRVLNFLYLELIFRNLQQNLSFLIPSFVDSSFQKCQIFCITRFLTDLVASWIRDELSKIHDVLPNSVQVEKLTGDNTRMEKDRVMQNFKEGICQVLVCTDVAGMGVDIPGLNFAVNVGIPKNPWKFQQQIGRIGRGGEKSVCISLIFPQKGNLAPEAKLRNMLKGSACYRKGLNQMFVLEKPFIDYTKPDVIKHCDFKYCEDMGACQCSACKCCSSCSDKCQCQLSIHDDTRMVERILGFGDDRYRYQ